MSGGYVLAATEAGDEQLMGSQARRIAGTSSVT